MHALWCTGKLSLGEDSSSQSNFGEDDSKKDSAFDTGLPVLSAAELARRATTGPCKVRVSKSLCSWTLMFSVFFKNACCFVVNVAFERF
jgi:hypothetical protein